MALATGAGTAAGQCDRSLTPVEGVAGYRSRGERCEGIYVSPISSTVRLLSLVRGAIEYDLTPGSDVVVTAPHDSSLYVRAVATLPGTYYRMDATLATSRPLAWPVADVLLEIGLGPDDLGVFAWYDPADGERVFIPVRVAPQRAPATDDPVHLVLRTDFDVDDVRWRATPLGEQAESWKDMSQSFIAGRPIVIRLPPGRDALLRVTVLVRAESTGEWQPLRLLIRSTGS